MYLLQAVHTALCVSDEVQVYATGLVFLAKIFSRLIHSEYTINRVVRGWVYSLLLRSE